LGGDGDLSSEWWLANDLTLQVTMVKEHDGIKRVYSGMGKWIIVGARLARFWSLRCLIVGARDAHCGAKMAQSWSQRCLIVGARDAHCGAKMAQSWSQRCLIVGAREAHCGAMMTQSWRQRCLIVGA
jgi:hypothetical protein